MRRALLPLLALASLAGLPLVGNPAPVVRTWEEVSLPRWAEGDREMRPAAAHGWARIVETSAPRTGSGPGPALAAAGRGPDLFFPRVPLADHPRIPALRPALGGVVAPPRGPPFVRS